MEIIEGVMVKRYDTTGRIDKKGFRLSNYATRLYLSDSLREPLIRTIVSTLNLPKGSAGVDIGCGIGSNTLLLAEAVGTSGNVVGIDLSEDLLKYAQERADGAALSPQIVFRKCDMNSFFENDNSFDWAWSMDCVGYSPGDSVHLLKKISRIVKPGGRIFILAWSAQQLLPGYPQLEARLNATSSGIAPFVNGRPPATHFLRALGWFEAAGIKEYTAQTFVGDIQAPLDNEKRKALISLFEMRWGAPKSEMSEDDYSEFKRLCHPDSPDFILNFPDYYGFFTYTMFHGKVAQ
ncbi:MAG: methyltransferase domain-containing protein [Desulfobacteraceae bacterium]|jgi:demethylmenaquinone methyltransferase/2-methoxy-6-polyprenyl-1,4-benzoquinol methylase